MFLTDFYRLPDLLKLNFRDDIITVYVKQHRRLFILIRKEALPEITNYFIDELNFRYIISSAMNSKKGFEIIYHFSDDKTGYIINLNVELPINKPEIESLANMIEAANWIEREIHELFGIKFINHPNPSKLISEGNWKDDEFPYARQNQKSTPSFQNDN